MSRGAVLAGLVLAVAAAIAVSLRFGAVGLGWSGVWEGLSGNGDPIAVAITRDLRLPRAVLAALVGGALGLAGATFQALLRNPLADPYVLGVSGGAAVGAVLIALVLRIATNVERRLDVRVLLLSGVVAGTFFNACILLALSFQETEAFRAAVFWMMGGLGGASWRSVWMLALALGGASIVLFGLARSFDLIAHGEETAGFLGVPVQRVRLLAYLTASLLTAGAVVAAGGIGFVGLFVPHTVRLVWGGGHRFLLPATLLVGAAFLPLADTVARVITAPAELPLGVITAFVGVPFFVLVLRRQTRRAPA
jgi:iron complex transport system permease protein